MNATPPLPVLVTESPDRVRYCLPRVDPKRGVKLLWGGASLAGPIAVLPWFFPDLFPGADSGDRLVFGTLLLLPFLAGLGIIGRGIWLMAGHVEIELTGDRLRSIARLGPFALQGHRPRAGLRRFLLRRPTTELRSINRANVAEEGQACQLVAEWSDGRSWVLTGGYPAELLLALAGQLSERCQLDPDEASKALGVSAIEFRVAAGSESPVARQQAAPPSRKMKVGRMVGMIWLLGLMLTLGGCFAAVDSLQAIYGTLAAEGTVVSARELTVVRYEVDGKTYDITSKWSASFPLYSTGEKVVVRFPADRPGKGRIESFFELWLTPLIGLGGLLVVCAGILWALVMSRRETAPAQGAHQ